MNKPTKTQSDDAVLVRAAFPNCYAHAVHSNDSLERRRAELAEMAIEARGLGWRLVGGEPVPPGI